MLKDVAREKGRRMKGKKSLQRRIPFGNLIKGLKLFGSFFFCIPLHISGFYFGGLLDFGVFYSSGILCASKVCIYQGLLMA